jgi:hypothetical protein
MMDIFPETRKDSIIDTELPNRMYERKLRPEPSSRKSRRDILEPNCPTPRTDNDEPKMTSHRTLVAAPLRIGFTPVPANIESPEPILLKARIDTEDPRSKHAKTDRLQANRPKLRTENELPISFCRRREKFAPKIARAVSDNALPQRLK